MRLSDLPGFVVLELGFFDCLPASLAEGKYVDSRLVNVSEEPGFELGFVVASDFCCCDCDIGDSACWRQA
jgi:hypothetical protein